MARSNAWRVPEPCSRTIHAAPFRSSSVSARFLASGCVGAENTTSSSSRKGVTSSWGWESSPSISPTSISKLATRRAISSVLAMSRRTTRARALAHVARHQRHGDVVADRERRADAQAAAVGVARRARSRARGPDPRAPRRGGAAPGPSSLSCRRLPMRSKSRDVELALEVGERAADRRLRHGELVAGAADAAGAGDGEEDLELAERVSHIGNTG